MPTQQHPRAVVRLITIAGSLLILLFATSRALAQPSDNAQNIQVAQELAPTADTISLALLLAHANANAPALKTSEARVEVAEADVAQASPLLPANPQFGLSLGPRSSGGTRGLDYQITFSQQIQVSGERSLRKKAAKASVTLATRSQDEIRWQIHVSVHRMHNELLLLADRRQQAERFVAFSKSLRTIAQGQVKAGETAPLTLLVADADLAQTQNLLIGIRQQEASSQTALRALIGWPVDRELRLGDRLPAPLPAPKIDQLLALMAEHHPSLKTREAAVIARQAGLEAQQRSVWPKPTIGATYSREAGLAGQPDARILLFGLSLPIPLWQRNQGGVARAQAELSVARRQQQQVAVVLESKLRQTANAMNAAAQGVELYERSVIPQLEKNLQSLQRAYELGEVGLLPVSQTRDRLLQGSKQYLDARFTYFRSLAALEGFVGTELPHSAKENQ